MKINFMWKNHPGATRHPSKKGDLSRAALVPSLEGCRPQTAGGFPLLQLKVDFPDLSGTAKALTLTEQDNL